MNKKKLLLSAVAAITCTALQATVIQQDDFSAYALDESIGSGDWQVKWDGNDVTQQDLFTGTGNGTAVLDTTATKDNYHAVAQSSLSLTGDEIAVLSVDLQITHNGLGNPALVNRGFFGLGMSTTNTWWDGTEKDLRIGNRNAAIGCPIPVSPWVEGWINWSSIGIAFNGGVDDTSSWLTKELRIRVDGTTNTYWMQTIWKYAGGSAFFTSTDIDTNIAEGTAIYPKMTNGWIGEPADPAPALLFTDLKTGVKAIEVDNFTAIIGDAVDSDGDNYTDAQELAAGSNPLNAEDNPLVFFATDFSAAEGYTAGPITDNGAWVGQASTVDPTGTGTVSNDGAGWLRSRLATGILDTPGTFNSLDTMRVTAKFQMQLDDRSGLPEPLPPSNAYYLNLGFRDETIEHQVEYGFNVQFNSYQSSSGGSVRFFPQMGDTAPGDSIYIEGMNLGLDYDGINNGGIPDLVSDWMEITWTFTIDDAVSGTASVSKMSVKNLATNQKYDYDGPQQFIPLADQEETWIYCKADDTSDVDVDLVALDGTYFDIYGATGAHRIWYDVTGVNDPNTAPADPGAGVYVVSIDPDEIADIVASNTNAVIDALADFNSSVPGNDPDRLIVEAAVTGPMDDMVDGDGDELTVGDETGFGKYIAEQGVTMIDQLWFCQQLAPNGNGNTSASLDSVKVEYGSVLVDVDQDGLPAAYELAFGSSDALLDSDGDYSSDIDEISNGTDPGDPTSFPGGTVSEDDFEGWANNAAIGSPWSATWDANVENVPLQQSLMRVFDGVGRDGSKGVTMAPTSVLDVYYRADLDTGGLGSTGTDTYLVECDFQFTINSNTPSSAAGTPLNYGVASLFFNDAPAWWDGTRFHVKINRSASADAFRITKANGWEQVGWITHDQLGMPAGKPATGTSETTDWMTLRMIIQSEGPGTLWTYTVQLQNEAGEVLVENIETNVDFGATMDTTAGSITTYPGIGFPGNGLGNQHLALQYGGLDAWVADNFYATAVDSSQDLDSDGLNAAEELILGTNDRNLDSDGDGINDDTEIAYGTNPANATSVPAGTDLMVPGGSSVAGGDMTINFTGIPNAEHKLVWSATVDGTYTDTGLTTTTDGSGNGTFVYTLTGAGGFLRVAYEN